MAAQPATEIGLPIKLGGGSAAASVANLPELTDRSTLRDYLAYAALNNPQLEAAFDRWKAALEMVPQMRALPDPHFNFGYFVEHVETKTGPQLYRAGISQTYPWFGKLKLRGEAAMQAANSAEAQYEEAKLKLFDDVKQAYYELYYLRRALAVTGENVVLVGQFEEIAQAKYRAGTALYADVVKAQVQLDTLRDRLRTLEDLRSPLTARLDAALNRPPDAPVPLPADLARGTLPAAAGELVARLKESNPMLKSFDFQSEQEKADIALARKDFYPDVTVGLDYIETGPAQMPGVAGSSRDPLMPSISVNIPLWRGKYRAEVRQHERRYAATREERQDMENQLSAGLTLALFKFRDAERKIALYRDALVPKADEDVRVIRRSYESGKADFLSLIDSERVLLEFQLASERAATDREQSLATMERLVGNNPSPSSAQQP